MDIIMILFNKTTCCAKEFWMGSLYAFATWSICIGCILNIVSKKTNEYSARIPNLVKHPVQTRHVATTYILF